MDAKKYTCPHCGCGNEIGEYAPCPGDIGTGLRAGGVILALALGWCTGCGAVITYHHSDDDLARLVARVAHSRKLSHLVDQLPEAKP